MLGKRVRHEQTAKNLAAAFGMVAALLSTASAAEGTEIRKGPYLQALGQKSVTIKLELASPEIASIDVTGPAGFQKTYAADSAKRFHAIRVDGLSPGTTYTYKVTAPGAETKPIQISTAPADDRPFKFVVYGDSRSDAATHAAIARMIEKAPGEFFVHTGDMVQDGDNAAQWQEFFSIETPLLASRCAFVAVGNHELTTPDPAGQINFLRYFASMDDDGKERSHLYGSFRWSNTRFFLLNAMDTWTGEEREWLRAELASAMNEPGLLHRVAVLHHGPFSSGRHGNNVRLHAQGIVDLFRDNKVDLVLAGHDHAYERGEGQGIKYIISGGAGAPLYSKDHRTPETQFFESVHHFLEVSVDGDAVSILARRASGSIIETCRYKGSEPWSCAAGEGKPGAASKETPPSPPSVKTASSCVCSAAGAEREAFPPLGAVLLGGLVAWSRRGARRRGSGRENT